VFLQLLRFLGSTLFITRRAAGWCKNGKMIFGLTPETWRVIGYVRDAVVILAIVAGGMYVLSHPEKVDAFLTWMLGRH
jgi:hypothetical protein